MKPEIKNRTDIELLVNTFYQQVKADELLGPIFTQSIPSNKWPDHIQKLTDFWETNLFAVPKFKGNPILKHQIVDANHHYSISQDHFARWLHIWFKSIDHLFSGTLANRAKNAARRISTGQYLAIWSARPKG